MITSIEGKSGCVTINSLKKLNVRYIINTGIFVAQLKHNWLCQLSRSFLFGNKENKQGTKMDVLFVVLISQVDIKVTVIYLCVWLCVWLGLPVYTDRIGKNGGGREIVTT